MMRVQIVFILTFYCCHCVHSFSSFWAPLFDPRILNYRVDVSFDPDAGKNARAKFVKNHGTNGEELVASFGNGKGPKRNQTDRTELKFYYTYKGANKDDDTYVY